MRKRFLKFLNLAVMPVPYPQAAGWHAIVGMAAWWWLRYGAPTSYTFTKLLAGAGIGLAVGGLLTLVLAVIQKDEA